MLVFSSALIEPILIIAMSAILSYVIATKSGNNIMSNAMKMLSKPESKARIQALLVSVLQNEQLVKAGSTALHNVVKQTILELMEDQELKRVLIERLSKDEELSKALSVLLVQVAKNALVEGGLFNLIGVKKVPLREERPRQS
jgi:rRNA pseudouridine-1189 N-methylase Emg1 (Nep1/Mra1 family)